MNQLTELTELVKKPLSELKRKVIVALITQDVHGRDIVNKLNEEDIDNVNDFLWTQQLRFY